MIVRKSPYEVGIALLIVIVNSFAVGMTFWGTFRRWLNETDETWVTSDHLVLGGNILQALALFGTLYFLAKSDAGLLTAGLGIAMIVLLVIVLYMSQYYTVPGQNSAAQISILIFLSIDLLVKTYSLLLGFGVCTVNDVTQMVGGFAKKLRIR